MVDLTDYCRARAALLQDLRQVCGEPALSPARALGVLRAIADFCDWEDAVLWPLVRDAAGAAVDLGPLCDDHSELRPVLRRLDDAVAAGSPEAAVLLRELCERFGEHIEAEEREVLPALSAYVRPEDYAEAVSRRPAR
jgi:hypothetical protein